MPEIQLQSVTTDPRHERASDQVSVACWAGTAANHPPTIRRLTSSAGGGPRPRAAPGANEATWARAAFGVGWPIGSYRYRP
jgi:hypothetical protein